jgi:hypothetical protein
MKFDLLYESAMGNLDTLNPYDFIVHLSNKLKSLEISIAGNENSFSFEIEGEKGKVEVKGNKVQMEFNGKTNTLNFKKFRDVIIQKLNEF